MSDKTLAATPANPDNLTVWRVIAEVSAGSLASLTGLQRYDQVDAFSAWMFEYLWTLATPIGSPNQWREHVTSLFAIYKETTYALDSHR